jgi:alpha-amylase
MSDRVVLSLAIHNHQPVGNFPHVFEAAYAQSYRPMLEALERHPRIRLALHYSGPLLDWLEGAHPEFFPMLRALVDRGQVELMTGGYYEPILSIIADRDRQGQIRKMTIYLQRRFGSRPSGLWLAERVWEPHLARSIAEAGVAYTIVDDAHFLAAGLRPEALTGAFVTEDEGIALKVFPSLRALRYLIPWKSPEEVVAWLREHRGHGDPVLLMGDDGEKFGLWPGTYAHCWEQGWVEQFFAAVEREAEWLQMLLPGEAAALRPAGRAYLPTASYDEMEEWALPVDAGVEYTEIRHRLADAGDPALRFLRGGFWRQFLVKYPEVNTMHKKMLRVSEKVWRMTPGRRRLRALDELWQGQCNCPYWHGVFGGVYLPHIRRANFAHLIAAEAMADGTRRGDRMGAGGASAGGRSAGAAVEIDLDADGAREVELSAPSMVLWLDPQRGGGVVVWDWRAAAVNLVNVLTRRSEAYHRQLIDVSTAEGAEGAVETIHTTRVRVKETGLERLLRYDPYRRTSFLDHILPSDVSPEAFRDGVIPLPFAGQEYAVALPGVRGHPIAVLSREAAAAGTMLTLEKQFLVDLQRARLRTTYRLTNTGSSRAACRFGVELNWAVTDPEAPFGIDGRTQPARDSVIGEGSRLEVRDFGWPGPVTVSFPRGAIWRFPLETVSNSEAGFERTFQGVTTLCSWLLSLDPGQSFNATLETILGARG